MTDPGVQLVREWLQRQPFSLRILTLILFMEEAVKDQFGGKTMNSFGSCPFNSRKGLNERKVANVQNRRKFLRWRARI